MTSCKHDGRILFDTTTGRPRTRCAQCREELPPEHPDAAWFTVDPRDLQPGDRVRVSFRRGFWGTVVEAADGPRGLAVHYDARPGGTWYGLEHPDPDRPVTFERAEPGADAR